MSSIAALRELHATIGAALDDIDRVYTAQGLTFPSLDVPTSQQAAAEKLTSDPVVSQASNIAYAACNRLAASVQQPFFALLQGAHFGHITGALSLLESSHAAEILRDAGPQGLHVSELARKIEDVRGIPADATVDRLDPAKLGHALRLLATCHWIREVKPDVFALNRVSSLLDTGKTVEQLKTAPSSKYDETDGVAALIGMLTSELFRTATALAEWVLPSKEQNKKPPTPFHLAYNTELDFYSWLELPENADKLTRAGRAMSAGGISEGTLSMADKAVFPWDTLPQNAVVVDVGGGIGSVAVQLAEPYPHLRVVVQDRPQTCAIAPKVWGTKHKDLFDSGRVTFQAQDFFTPQPATLQVPDAGTITHPAVYIVTRVMHNWPDAECVKILSHLRAAAGPETKLVIHEVILPLACPEPEADAESQAQAVITSSPGLDIRPPLLLPYSSMADLQMMTALNSKERTLREMSNLAREAGWRIVAVARSDSPLTWGYLTAVPI